MPQLGGKSFRDRNSGGTPILQRSDTGTVNWTTDWVNTDGSTTVADGAKLTFNHNLGTTNITVDVYVCDNASGTGEVNKLEEVFFQNVAGAFVSHGCQVQDITDQQLTVTLSYYGYAHWTDGGTAGSTDAVTTRGFGASNAPDYKQKYIKVVATASSSGGIAPTGTITAFAGSSAPAGYLLCDGSEYSETTYATLFSVIGSVYNTGEETANHFRVPDLRGRVIAGLDNMGGTSGNRLTDLSGGLNGDVLGATGGNESHTLSESQIPAHTHGIGGRTLDMALGGSNYRLSPASGSIGDTKSTGGGEAHNNVQPTIILNYIIKI
jgi:microcystin-dependent protein